MNAPRADEVDAYALVGPTAVGKTALSLALAPALGAEIISLDSRQIYRGMDIGTAKATPEERARVPHHGLDLVDPNEVFSAGAYARYVRGVLAELRARGHRALLVGGTGFYLRALTHPLFAEPPLDPERRRALRVQLERHDDATLRRWLAALDPESAARLARWGGRQRLLRALELPLLTGRPLSWWQRHAPPEAPPLRVAVVVLERPKAELDERIATRARAMMAAGLVDEVRRLLAAGYRPSDPGFSATGYAELVPHVEGRCDEAAALAALVRNTRAYSRRQRTWFRHQLPTGTPWLDARRPSAELVREILRLWNLA